MASPEWLEIFRSYTADELASHVVSLKKQITVFSSQTVKDKSYTKDLGELKSQLSSAIRIQTERRQPPGSSRMTVADFSGI